MPNWILRIAASWGYPWIISATAQYLRQDRALVAALKKYRANGTFVQMAGEYAKQTPQTSDDQIVPGIEQLKQDLTVKPFSQLVTDNQILAMLGSTKIPDFDNDPTDDVSLADVLGQIVDKVVSNE